MVAVAQQEQLEQLCVMGLSVSLSWSLKLGRPQAPLVALAAPDGGGALTPERMMHAVYVALWSGVTGWNVVLVARSSLYFMSNSLSFSSKQT